MELEKPLFTRAVKHDARARIALMGPSGSGKTYTALAFARRLASEAGDASRIAFLDTEHGSAAKYADIFTFDHFCPSAYTQKVFTQALNYAETHGYHVFVVDSLSHFWMGHGGALEFVDAVARRSAERSGGRGDTFGAWREWRPLEREMVDRMLASPLHIIVCMRVKTDWVRDVDESGKTQIRKVGLRPVQAEGLEYEFDVVGELDSDNVLVITKTRCSKLVEAGRVFRQPGDNVMDILIPWLRGLPAPAAENKASAGEAFAALRERFGPRVAEYHAILTAAGLPDPAACSAEELSRLDRGVLTSIYKLLTIKLKTPPRTEAPEPVIPQPVTEEPETSTAQVRVLAPADLSVEEYREVYEALSKVVGKSRARVNDFIFRWTKGKQALLDYVRSGAVEVLDDTVVENA